MLRVCRARQDNFNPLPRKEGDQGDKRIVNALSHFNPLPRKEGDDRMGLSPREGLDISIHSLVKRETQGNLQMEALKSISIHSLVKRETTTFD